MVADQLGQPAELVFISTEGDENMAPLARIGGAGVFVSAVRDALLDGRVDLAVHSMKDLPTAPAEGIMLACSPVREDPRDVLCARDGLTLDTLPEGARVGTGSARRAAQLLAARPDLKVEGLRGNIDTRLSKVIGVGENGELDAIVLAAAGLSRADRRQHITEFLDPTVMLPAPAQGALAVECLVSAREESAAQAAAALHDPITHACTRAERAFLNTLEAGCTAPVAAYATVADGQLTLDGLAIAVDGSRRASGRVSGTVEEAVELGRGLARELLAEGAADLIRS